MIVCTSPYHQAAENLALEECLLEGDESLLLLYSNEPCVVIGCNQSASAEADLDFCRARNISVLRRISGGGAVYHDRGNLNFCFIGPRSENPMSAAFLDPIIEALSQLGLDVSAGPRKDLWLTHQGRVAGKISGTASHVGKHRLLQHGTLLFDTRLDDLERALDLPHFEAKHRLSKGVASVPSRVCNLRPFLPVDMEMSDFIGTFVETCARLMNTTAIALEPIQPAIAPLLESKYLNENWNYKK